MTHRDWLSDKEPSPRGLAPMLGMRQWGFGSGPVANFFNSSATEFLFGPRVDLANRSSRGDGFGRSHTRAWTRRRGCLKKDFTWAIPIYPRCQATWRPMQHDEGRRWHSSNRMVEPLDNLGRHKRKRPSRVIVGFNRLGLSLGA